MTEQELREQIDRYRRLLAMTVDKLAREALIGLIAEAEDKLRELLKQLDC
jgi:hypothetical protein